MAIVIYVNHYDRYQNGPKAARDQRQLKALAAMKTNVAKLSGKIALVAGASSGIGEATAQRLATAGYKVYGTSRRGSPVGSGRASAKECGAHPVDMSTFSTPRPKGYTDHPVLS